MIVRVTVRIRFQWPERFLIPTHAINRGRAAILGRMVVFQEAFAGEANFYPVTSLRFPGFPDCRRHMAIVAEFAA